ncbi:MAG: hypothetical protein HYY94_05650 [Gemmatimonadetes bacterium]|nr:hypothetical protein [Gemmatimonadota bacterium]
MLLDTQWWLHRGAKPRHPVSPCPADSEAEILDALRLALRPLGPRRVIVMGHLPIQSGGPHGGHFGWMDHVFPLRRLNEVLWLPLPALGSVYPLARMLGVSNQDLSSAAYRRMATGLERVFEESPPLIYAAGHDHGLQAIGGRSARYLLVSGAGVFGPHERVVSIDRTLFAAETSGYMRVEFLRDGLTRLGAQVVDQSGHAFEAFSMWLD